MTELNDRQAWLLSKMAYANIADSGADALARYSGRRLRDIIAALRTEQSGKWRSFGNGGGSSQEDFQRVMEQIAADPVLGDLKLKDYLNDNQATGFVAYAFEDQEGQAVLSFRGSEGLPEDALSQDQFSGFLRTDWLDNYAVFLADSSRQFPLAADFMNHNRGAAGTFVTGHSKGAMNALYAAAVAGAAGIGGLRGKVWDGTGIGNCLSPDEDKALRDNPDLVNYVCGNDPVGASGFHPEARVFCDSSGQGYFSDHHPDRFVFDQAGNVQHDAGRTTVSYATEAASQQLAQCLKDDRSPLGWVDDAYSRIYEQIKPGTDIDTVIQACQDGGAASLTSQGIEKASMARASTVPLAGMGGSRMANPDLPAWISGKTAILRPAAATAGTNTPRIRL